MSDFETPLMRDISKIIPQIFLGLLMAIGSILFFVFPFNLTVYGEHCSVTTSYSIAKWILESLTLQC
jgi:hypothetical protein